MEILQVCLNKKVHSSFWVECFLFLVWDQNIFKQKWLNAFGLQLLTIKLNGKQNKSGEQHIDAFVFAILEEFIHCKKKN